MNTILLKRRVKNQGKNCYTKSFGCLTLRTFDVLKIKHGRKMFSTESTENHATSSANKLEVQNNMHIANWIYALTWSLYYKIVEMSFATWLEWTSTISSSISFDQSTNSKVAFSIFEKAKVVDPHCPLFQYYIRNLHSKKKNIEEWTKYKIQEGQDWKKNLLDENLIIAWVHYCCLSIRVLCLIVYPLVVNCILYQTKFVKVKWLNIKE